MYLQYTTGLEMHHPVNIILCLALFAGPIFAQENTPLSNEDHRLINTTSLNFNVCVQQNAAEQLNNFVDVKEIAAHAVNHCDDKLTEIREQLGAKMNPNSYSGLERHIKNRAIKKLLLQLMYHKSAQAADEADSE